jgi:hypothetical protein
VLGASETRRAGRPRSPNRPALTDSAGPLATLYDDRMSVPDRCEAVAQLTDEGMSTRQIGDVLGVGHSTVVRDGGANAPASQAEVNADVATEAPSGADAPTKPEPNLPTHAAEARAQVLGHHRACLMPALSKQPVEETPVVSAPRARARDTRRSDTR